VIPPKYSHSRVKQTRGSWNFDPKIPQNGTTSPIKKINQKEKHFGWKS